LVLHPFDEPLLSQWALQNQPPMGASKPAIHAGFFWVSFHSLTDR
jgi:hypothetical protein